MSHVHLSAAGSQTTLTIYDKKLHTAHCYEISAINQKY